MGKRTANDIDPSDQDIAMLEGGYTESMQSTILTKIKTEKGKAEACALLSALDPRSGVVRESFLTSAFCTEHFYPCLISQDLSVVLEASNTVKTWLNSGSEDPSLEAIRRMYGLQLMPVLLQSIQNTCVLLQGFTDLPDDKRKALQEIIESLLASVMILAENLQVSLDQINKSTSAIQLIVGVYEKRQFLSDDLIIVAAECLSVLTEENEEFFDNCHGIRLYSLLLSLPQDWTITKAVPLTLRSLLAMSAVHGGDSDRVYERCLDTICAILAAPALPADLISASFETLANMLEEVDPACLADEDRQVLMRCLELTCSALSSCNEEAAVVIMTRGLGALTNLLVLMVDTTGDNINAMMWKAAWEQWLPRCTDEESLSGLMTVLRLLQLNLPCSLAKCTPTELQHLVNGLKPFKTLYQSSLMTILPLIDRNAMPSGFDQIVLDVLPTLGKADPEELEEMTAMLDEKFGKSSDPLPIRLQSIFL